MTPPSFSGRKLAWVVLQKVYRSEVFADETFDATIKDHRVSDQDRALAFELVYGVLRHALMLDWRLDHVSRKPMARLPLNVATTLRIAAYQLLYLDRIPHSAAVNEAVQLIRHQPRHNWRGLVNAILRNLIRQPIPVLPDSSGASVEALSLEFSCPPWLVERWVKNFGKPGAEDLCRKTLEIPPLTIRSNTLHLTREELLEKLHQEGYSAHETPVSPEGIRIEKGGNITHLPGYEAGWWYVEDEAAQLIPLIVDPQRGERILDACAAPGGKTTYLAQLMQNQGTIVAGDRHQGRLNRLQENCRRLGVSIVEPLHWDFSQPEDVKPTSKGPHPWIAPSSLRSQPFDRILVDAPCSALGILRRHPEGKLLKNPSVIHRAQSVQRQILDHVSGLLRPGGIIVYSACSIEPEETTDILRGFCRQHPEYQPEPVTAWLPPAGYPLVTQAGHLCTGFHTFSMDGFFAGRLKKSE